MPSVQEVLARPFLVPGHITGAGIKWPKHGPGPCFHEAHDDEQVDEQVM